MSEKWIAPFSQAAQDVFKLMLDLDTQAGSPTSEKPAAGANSLNISIGLTGDLSGEVHYAFPIPTALGMVRIMCGMDIDQVDDFVTSAMQEIANIISGNALTGLSERQVACDLLPPRITAGDGGAPAGAGPFLRIPIQTDLGEIEVGLQLHPVQ